MHVLRLHVRNQALQDRVDQRGKRPFARQHRPRADAGGARVQRGPVTDPQVPLHLPARGPRPTSPGPPAARPAPPRDDGAHPGLGRPGPSGDVSRPRRHCRRWGNGTLRITSRQDFQVHGVLKANLKATTRAINQALLTNAGRLRRPGGAGGGGEAPDPPSRLLARGPWPGRGWQWMPAAILTWTAAAGPRPTGSGSCSTWSISSGSAHRPGSGAPRPAGGGDLDLGQEPVSRLGPPPAARATPGTGAAAVHGGAGASAAAAAAMRYGARPTASGRSPPAGLAAAQPAPLRGTARGGRAGRPVGRPPRAGSSVAGGCRPARSGAVTALELLAGAEFALHDALVPAEVLRLCGPQATLIDVGKRPGTGPDQSITARMVQLARSGHDVVRLKGAIRSSSAVGARSWRPCAGRGSR